MFGSSALEVALGLMAIFLLLGLACTAVNEWVSQLKSWRGKILQQGICRLFTVHGAGYLCDKLYKSPLISALGSGAKSPPSYIEPKTFVMALLTTLAADQSIPATELSRPEHISKLIAGLPQENDLAAVLALLWSRSGGDVQKFEYQIEQWYESIVDRLIGWYKKRIQYVTLMVSMTLASVANVDAFAIAQYLAHQPEARAQMVALEQHFERQIVESPGQEKTLDKLASSIAQLRQAQLPLGWSGEGPQEISDWLLKICGIIVTAFAASLGAPFWFDILKKVMSVRGAGISPREKGVH